MKIADLFASLGIKTDRTSFSKARGGLKKFADDGKKTLGKLDQAWERQKRNADGTFKELTAGQQAFKGLTRRILGLGAAIASIDQVRRALDFDEQLSQLTVNSQGAIGTMDELRNKVLDVSDSTSVNKEQVLAGAAAFVEFTGDGKAAADSLETFAKVARASGASITDVALTAGAMQKNLNIDPANFEKAFSVLIRGGKLGAVELKDLSRELSTIAPLAGEFKGGQGVEGLAKLGSALQLIRQGTGSASEASTALKSFITAVQKKSGKLEGFGVRVFDDNKELNALGDIAKQIDELIPKDQLVKVLGRTEAKIAVQQLNKIKGAWAEMEEQTLSANDVAEDFALRMNTSSAKVLAFWNRLKNGLARVFAVIIDGLALLTDHTAFLAIQLGVLGFAFLVLKRRVIAAAIPMLLAQLKMWAPTLAIVAVLTTIALIIEDLVAFVQGRDSLMGRFLGPKTAEKFRDAIRSAARWLKKAFDTAKKIWEFTAGTRTISRDAVKVSEAITAGEDPEEVLKKFGGNAPGLIALRNAQRQQDRVRAGGGDVATGVTRGLANLAREGNISGLTNEEQALRDIKRQGDIATKQFRGAGTDAQRREQFASTILGDVPSAKTQIDQINIVINGGDKDEVKRVVKEVIDGEVRQ